MKTNELEQKSPAEAVDVKSSELLAKGCGVWWAMDGQVWTVTGKEIKTRESVGLEIVRKDWVFHRGGLLGEVVIKTSFIFLDKPEMWSKLFG